MKMKEVCAQTGLTERAVRFYVQEKLVVPLAQRRGGRTWLDFSPNHVDRLKAISTLRKAGFTLEEIRAMIEDFQKNASGAAFSLRQRLQAAIDAYDKLRFTDTAQASGLEDYAALLDKLQVLGPGRAANFHVHFSRIAYTKGGEKCHLTFADTDYGPPHEPLLVLLKARGLTPTIICESAGTQAEDAGTLSQAYASL